MMHVASSSLGADLRALRKARQLTLSDMAEALGRSVGWLSQVERDLSAPSISDLRDIAAYFGVPLSLLARQHAQTETEDGYIVRAHARRKLGNEISGLVEEILSPDLTDDFEVVHSTFAPMSQSEQAVQRPTQELGYMVSGHLKIGIGSRSFDVGPGDSFRIRGEPYTWENPGDAPAIAIWVIAPPVY